VRGAMIGWMAFAALLLGMSIGRAADRDETTFTAQVSSADHETDEGYFSLGTDATVLAKPGTELQRFLARQNGRKVRITLTLVGAEQLQKLER
jgi:hypothetical protein